MQVPKDLLPIDEMFLLLKTPVRPSSAGNRAACRIRDCISRTSDDVHSRVEEIVVQEDLSRRVQEQDRSELVEQYDGPGRGWRVHEAQLAEGISVHQDEQETGAVEVVEGGRRTTMRETMPARPLSMARKTGDWI
jgi:hypothetical protein